MNSTTKIKKDKKEKSKKTSPAKSFVTEKKVEKEKQIVENLENLKKTNEELLNKIKSLQDENLRSRAELENQKKDFIKEMEKITKMLKYNISKELIEKVLPLFDSYDRAIKISQTYQDPKLEQFLIGFQMTFAGTQNDFFKKEGIEEIKIFPLKDVYNRELHYSPEEAEENNDYPEGTILEVLKKGYLYQNKVLRPAEVKVSKKKV